ncbi:hypothetical protein CRYUN_Cryun01aG0110300 [Craigia yunnanensis]
MTDLLEDLKNYLYFLEQLFSWYGHIFLNLGYFPSGSSIILADEFSREPSSFLSHIEGDEQVLPIDPISDLGINKINVLMFDDAE